MYWWKFSRIWYVVYEHGNRCEEAPIMTASDTTYIHTCMIIILLAHDLFSSLAYPMITHKPSVAGNLSIKTLAALRFPQVKYKQGAWWDSRDFSIKFYYIKLHPFSLMFICNWQAGWPTLFQVCWGKHCIYSCWWCTCIYAVITHLHGYTWALDILFMWR